MNFNRFIWLTTTILFCIVGAIVGWMAGGAYGSLDLQQGGDLVKGSMKYVVTSILCVGTSIIMMRVGSWYADRFVIPSLHRLHDYSPADRVLGVLGALLGMIFGVLLILPWPNDPWVLWLPVKLCIMAVMVALGLALLHDMREEMVRVFPQLESGAVGGAGVNGLSCTPKLLDTNVIIDGRIADLCKTGFIEGSICVPRFVLEEVQYIADSSDSMRRARGRRGLDVLNAMREQTVSVSTNGSTANAVPLVQVLNDIPSSVQKIESVDSKLVFLAKEMGAAILTNDFNLNRVAELQGVKVLNLNELAQSLKPVVLPGEEMNLTIVKEGKEPTQGVGYLEDGTMVVVGDGSKHIGETCKVVISSVYQTLAGKMIFADLKGMKGAGDDLFNDNGPNSGYRKNHDNGDDFSSRPSSGARRKGKP
ncbi:MAG: TRAM domain-containing protein [Abitibacteriaceae bacterium]|nr:TRAM domain-containing protein [Abditibacteriaceae bacterium]